MLNNVFFTLFFFYLVRLTWGYLAGLYAERHTGTSHFLPSCLEHIPFITCVTPHTPKQKQIVRPMSHTPVDTQQIITQKTSSAPSGQLTFSTSQEPEETLFDHQSYGIDRSQMDSPLTQWN
jgi:hypothetical protein